MHDDLWNEAAAAIEGTPSVGSGEELRSSTCTLPPYVLGAALAFNRLRNAADPSDPPPQVQKTPWGTIMIYWSDGSGRRVEVVSSTEAWEYRRVARTGPAGEGNGYRRFDVFGLVDDIDSKGVV